MILTFDACVLDTAKQQLWRDGELVHVEPQVLAVLEYLVANRERVVTKIELLDEVWGDRFVSESALTSRIKLARKACGDNGREQRIVKTVHSRGYRFAAEVAVADGTAPGEGAHGLPSASVSPAVSTTGDRGRRSSTTVIGRDDELARLDAALGDAASGGRCSVFVRGGIGSGKSRLVAELLERQDNLDEWLVAQGQCLHTRGGVEPYFCLFDALGRLARTSPGIVRSTLERVAPSWLAQMPALIDPDMTEQLERRLLGSTAQRMLREGADAFEALSQQRPLVLVLEDLQWADDCTLDVIDLLLQRNDPASLLLVGTVRADHASLGTLIGSALAGGRATLIELGPLDDDAVAALVSDRLGADVVSAELNEIVAERCGGVPLFAEEVILSWLRQGHVRVENRVVEVTGALGELQATIPQTLPSLIEGELAVLDPDQLSLLEVAAVAGEAFDAASVAAGLDRAVGETEAALTSMSRQLGLVGTTGASAWPDRTMSASFVFTHRLYRQLLYDRIPASRRMVLHGRIGARIEAGYRERAGEQAVVLAEHFIQAGDTLRAVEHLRVAGEQAAARSAHGHAADFLTDALVRLEETPPGVERNRAELHVRGSLGPTLVAIRGWFDESVSANYERCLELCADDEQCPEGAAARYGLATVSELRGQFEQTEALLLPLLEGERPGELALEAHELVACSTFHQGAFNRSLQNARMVLDSWDEDAYSVLMARIAEHPASSCSSWSSLASWALGFSDESLRQAERAVALGERNLYALSTAVQQRAMFHQIRNEPGLTIEWAEKCRQVGKDQNFPMRVIQADIYKGWGLGVTGFTGEGVRLISGGLERFRSEGATLNEAYYLGLFADTQLHAGDPTQTLELLAEALDRMQSTTRTYFFESELHRLRARGHLDVGAADATDRARDALRESEAIARGQGSPALTLRTVTDRLALEAAHGDAEPWKVTLRELMSIYEGQQPTPDVVRAHELLAI